MLSIILTATERNSNLAALSEKVATVIGVAETNGISRFQCGFFMQKIQFYIIMSNWVGQSKDWLDSFVPVRQFCSVRLHNWRYVVGLKTLQTEAVMPKSYAQNPLNNSVSEKHTITTNPKALDKISTEIFRTVATCNYVDKNISDYAELRRVEVEMIITDAQRLIDACNDALSGIEINPTQTSKSRFNVLTHTRQLVAECIPFNQAMQYQDCIVKFAGWGA